MFGTGSYGRNDQGDATADAAVLSMHLGRRCGCNTCATKASPGTPKAPLRSTAAAPGSMLGQGDRLREYQQGVLAPRHLTRAKDGPPTARRPSARPAVEAGAKLRDSGRLLHLRARTAGLGDRCAADGSRLAAAHQPSARSLWSADPVRQRILHGRGGGRDQYGSGRVPAAISQEPARPRRGPHRRRALRLGQADLAAQRSQRRHLRSAAASRSGGTSTPSSR